MIACAKRPNHGLRARFAVDGRRRVVTVEGGGLAEAERRRLKRLLQPLPVRSGSLQQTIRNILGNLSRLRAL